MRPLLAMCVAALGLAGACGDDGDGDVKSTPLIAGTLSGAYKGEPFTPLYGFATVYSTAYMIGLGDGPLGCASPTRKTPPSGTGALLGVPQLATGTYASQVVQVFQNLGQFESASTDRGTVTLTAVGAASIAGEISYSYLDDTGDLYALNGTFEVVRCP